MGINKQLEEFVKDTISIPTYFNAHILPTKKGLNKLTDHASSASVCPFHDDVKPSFRYWQVKRMFNCFGCGVSGDVINLHRLTLQRKNNVSVSRETALYDLCKLYNIRYERDTVKGKTARALQQAQLSALVQAQAQAQQTLAMQDAEGIGKQELGIVSTETRPEIIPPDDVLNDSNVFERCRRALNITNALKENSESFTMLTYRNKNREITERAGKLTDKLESYTQLDEIAGILISVTEDKFAVAAKLTAADTHSLF